MARQPTQKERIDELELKLKSIDNLEQKKTDTAQISANIENLNTQLTELKNKTDQLNTTSDTLKQEFEAEKQKIDQKVVEFGDVKNKTDQLMNNIESQLGIVSAEKLALAFKHEAEKLEDTSKSWFKRFFISICVLFIVTAMIVIWEILVGGQLLSTGLAIKFSMTAPLLYFVIFIHGQYNRSKYLADEYVFKSSVARSFEAYRQLLKEDGLNAENKIDSKVLDFFINTITQIYKSPCLPIDDVVSEKEAEGIIKRFLKIFKDFKL